MLAPIDFDNVGMALATPQGWADLALVAACLGVAWLVDRRARTSRVARAERLRCNGSVARVAFPRTALVLTLMATAVFRRYLAPPCFRPSPPPPLPPPP